MRTAERSPTALAVATAAYVAFIIYQSLVSGRPGECEFALVQQGSRLSVGDGMANFVAYLPLGILAGAWGATLARPRLIIVALLAISGLSLSMELLQACLSHRVSSWYDWTMNSLGGAVGLALPWLGVYIAGGRRGPSAGAAHPGGVTARGMRGGRLVHGVAGDGTAHLLWPLMLFAGAWVLASLSPWRFTFDVGTIRANLSFLRGFVESLEPQPWPLARHFFGWLAVGLGLHAALADWRRSLPSLAVLIAVSVIGQAMLSRRALSIDELLGMGCAFTAFAALVVFRLSPRAAALTLAVACWLSIAAYQLAPLQGRLALGHFHWWPQLGRGGLAGALVLSLLYCWFGLAAVLALRCLRGAQRSPDALPALAGLAVGAAMLALEAAQLRVPGRIADTSAPLIAMLAFAVGWAVTGQPLRPPGPPAPWGPPRRNALPADP